MADKKEKFVPNLSGDAAGTVSADGVRTVPLGSDIDALRHGVQKMKELAPPTYTSKNIVAAYQAYMDELISGYKTIEGGKETVKKPKNLLLDALGQRENSTYLPLHLTDVERYFVLLGNILLSGIVEDIDCTMSFIRLSGKMEGDKLINVHGAPYLEKYVEKSKPDTGLHVTKIMRELAGYINGGDDKVPTCAPTDPPSLKADLLPVIYLNGTMVAYYSVAPASDFCVYYPFNTIFSANPNGSDSLFGVKSVPPKVDKDKKDKLNTSGYYMWECNIFDFVKRFNKLTAEQQMLFLCSLDSLKDTQIPNEVISAFHTVLQAKGVAVNAAAIAAQTANLASKPLKIVPFKDIPAGIQGEDAQLNYLTLPKSNFRFPMVPDHFKDGIELPKNDYFMALAPSKLHAHAIKAADGQIKVFVSMDNNDPRPVDMDPGKCNPTPQIRNIHPFTFKINDQDVSNSEGVKIPLTDTVSVSVRYKDMIDLGDVLVSLGTKDHAEMSYDEATETLRYDYGTKIMLPMLSHYVRLESVKRKSDLLPVTKEFAQMIVANGYSLEMEEIPEFSHDEENNEDTCTSATVIIHVLRGKEEVCKPCIRKTYRTEEREVLGERQHMYVPEFSLYPFVNPVDQTGKLLWHQYILTGLHHIKESMTDFLDLSSMTAFYEDANVEELSFFKQRALKNDDYIARTAKLSQIPSGLYMTHKTYKEIGYIVVPEPPVWDCDTTKQAKLALDMGSRRSVINCQVGKTSNFNFYQPNRCVKRLTEIEIEQRQDNADALERMTFLRTLFLEGTHNANTSTFVSSVIQYDLEGNVTEEDRTTPFIGGRIIADMSSDFTDIIKKVFSADGGDAGNKAAAEDALASLGILSDFKRRILAAAIYGDFTDVQALFVKDAALHMALNALSNNCANLEYHFSTPTVNAGNDLASCWNDVKEKYLNNALNGCVITINAPHLESEALYRFKHDQLKASGAYRYTILIDGGDSTFDISLIEHTINTPQTSTPTVKRNLSIRYAGQNILVDSIRDVCRKWNIKKEEFLLLWDVGANKNSHQEDTYYELSEMLFKYSDDNNTVPEAIWKGEYAKDVIYQLIEKLGLDPMYDMVSRQKYPRHLRETKRRELSYEEQQKCDHFWEMVLDTIRFKYLMLMRCILLNVQNLISFDPKETTKTVQVLLYGNTNHVAELVWPDGRHGIDMASMQKWMLDVFSYTRSVSTEPSVEVADQETSQITTHVEHGDAGMKFKVVSEIDADKKALVLGMVTDDGAAAATPMSTKDLNELTSYFDDDKQKEFMSSGFSKELRKGELFYPERAFVGNKHYKQIVNKLADKVSPETQFVMSTSAVGTAVSSLGLDYQDVQENSLDALVTLYIINLYLIGYNDDHCDYDDATFFS